MSKITAIVNQKGGVGKTTTALNLSYALSQKGKNVLLIDFDPQASLTVALGHSGEDKVNIQTLMVMRETLIRANLAHKKKLGTKLQDLMIYLLEMYQGI